MSPAAGDAESSGGRPVRAAVEADAAMAVIAHGLLNSVSAIQMGAYALRESWSQMTDEQRDQVLGIVADQAAHVRGVLQDMIRGLPSEVIRALNGLERRPQEPMV
ncbi:MAG: hypothetical protein ACYCZV_13195 [Acidimicrobiales bacterium]